MGRRPTTGRFNTREELIEEVLHLYHDTDTKLAQVAHICRISAGTANRIVEDNPRPKKKPAAKKKRQSKLRNSDSAARRTNPTTVEGLWCWCFQTFRGLEEPFQAKILKDYGSRWELKVGRRKVTAHRGACSTNPFPETERKKT